MLVRAVIHAMLQTTVSLP